MPILYPFVATQVPDTKRYNPGADRASPHCQMRCMNSLPHILVVDDHRQIRDSVARFLERNGMRATAAKDARDMDEKLAKGHFDLMVLDVMMPG